MTVLNSKNRGDMFIEVRVETPVNLTKEQQSKLREFDELLKKGNSGKGAKSTSPESEGFFAKAKELWEDLTD